MQSDGKVHAGIYMFHNWILCRLTPLKIMKIAFVTIRLSPFTFSLSTIGCNVMCSDHKFRVFRLHITCVYVCVCHMLKCIGFWDFCIRLHLTSRPFRFLSSCTSIFMIFNYFIIHLKFSTENLLAYCLHSC